MGLILNEPMYPRVTNSPVAYLTASITDSQTTIEWDHIEYFADATEESPGIAVIGLGDDSETVTYTGKTGTTGTGTMTGVTREADTTTIGGVTQGSKKAWDAGTPGACMLTALLIDNIVSNFSSHKGSASDVHGVSGDVVGTNGYQTLYNKVLSMPNISDFRAMTHTHATDEQGGALDPSDIPYDGTTSGLTATDVKGAIDEVDGDLDTHIEETTTHGVSGDIVGTTSIQQLENKIYYLPTVYGGWNNAQHDHSSAATGGQVDAGDVTYDGTTSGLAATDVKAAVDEVDGDLDTHIADTTAHGTTGNVVGESDTQTLTNKTIDADLNTISNLAHGAEVDNPSSGVHGVTGSIVGTTDTQTLTNKSLTQPTIGDLTNMQHDHSNAANGGALDASDITFAPSGTGLTATTVQAALAELAKDVIVGFRIDTTSSDPSVTWVDINKNVITGLNTAFFDAHPIWGRIRRCVINSDQVITYGSNGRGDGLTLDGTAGDVMVECPEFYWAAEYDGNQYLYEWLSPYAYAGLPIYPGCVQRGGYITPMYWSAYESHGFDDSGTFKLGSATGKTPVTGGVLYTDLPNSGRFTIADSELYANNIGPGWGSENYWVWLARQMLMYCEYGTRQIQTALGRGVVDLDAGSGFAGKICGADSADTNIGTNGTGQGTGTDGETPIVWRGTENPYGNIWTFLTGIIAVDAEYQIVNRAGLSSAVMPAGSFSAGEFESSITAPTTSDGYIKTVVTADPLLLGHFIASDPTGSNVTYYCDYWYAHDAGETNILRGGGGWTDGDCAGPGCLLANGVSSTSFRLVGARLEYKPQVA